MCRSPVNANSETRSLGKVKVSWPRDAAHLMPALCVRWAAAGSWILWSKLPPSPRTVVVYGTGGGSTGPALRRPPPAAAAALGFPKPAPPKPTRLKLDHSVGSALEWVWVLGWLVFCWGSIPCSHGMPWLMARAGHGGSKDVCEWVRVGMRVCASG